jgi:hypothetical protein
VREPRFFQVDEENEKIIWYDTSGPSVRTANLDGGAPEIVLSDLPDTEVSGMVLDPVNRILYRSFLTTNSIQSFNIDTLAIETVVTDPSIGVGLTVDFASGPAVLYWIGSDFQGIYSSEVGSGIATEILNFNSGVFFPEHIAFAVPEGTGNEKDDGILDPDVVLDAAPSVSVTLRAAKIIMRLFTFADENPEPAMFDDSLSRFEAMAARNGNLVIRYDVRLTGERARDSAKKLSKKNEVTFKKLRPGAYTTNYKAIAFKKRTKKAKQKLLARGKSKFVSSFRPAFSTNFSPSAGFQITRP